MSVTSVCRSTWTAAAKAGAGVLKLRPEAARDGTHEFWTFICAHASLAVATAALVGSAGINLCDSSVDSFSSPVRDVRLALFKDWLREHGADIASVDFRPCQDADRGLGIHVSAAARDGARTGPWRNAASWLNPFAQSTLLAVPSQLLINERTVVRDEVIGATLQRHIDVGNIDGRQAVMLWLVLHRAMGRASPFHPYVSVLPATFDTPLCYDGEELSHLAGTTLHGGTLAARATLDASWSYIQPVLRELQAAAGLQHCSPKLDDYRWAFSVFWSRCIALPLPPAPPGAPGRRPEAAGPSEVESLVPGLDVANHSPAARWRWVVDSAGRAGADASKRPPADDSASGAGRQRESAQPADFSVQLVGPRRAVPKPGEEVCLSYGERSNDSLMFSYGFAELNNESDTVMVRFPLPPGEEWDDVLRARLLLLQERGLHPQLVLPRRLTQTASTSGGKTLSIPAQVRETLEILVMTPAELAVQLGDRESSDSPEPSGRGKRKGDERLEGSSAAALGLDLAVLSTLCRLLESKLDDMEGEGGTGTLEEDIALIQEGQGDMPFRHWNALVYRASQKRLVRTYLKQARLELQAVIREMQIAMDAELS